MIRGNSAQWIAQANEAPIPNASQLILNFIKDSKNTQKATMLQNRYAGVSLNYQNAGLPFQLA